MNLVTALAILSMYFVIVVLFDLLFLNYLFLSYIIYTSCLNEFVFFLFVVLKKTIKNIVEKKQTHIYNLMNGRGQFKE